MRIKYIGKFCVPISAAIALLNGRVINKENRTKKKKSPEKIVFLENAPNIFIYHSSLIFHQDFVTFSIAHLVG